MIELLDHSPAIANLLGLLAGLLLVPYLDRLRLLRWRTHQWRVVALHLMWALWLGWLAFDGLVAAQLDAYHLFGVVGAGMWLSVSQPTWRHGPPEYTHSDRAPLDSGHGDDGQQVPS